MKVFMLILFSSLLFVSATVAQQLDSPIPNDALIVLVNARTDLELLAENQLQAQRPVGWSGSLDVTDPQLPVHIWLDLELLTARLLDISERPIGWFGPAPGSYYAIARDIRHDLELLADEALSPGERPIGWVGGTPLMRCDRAVQSLAETLAANVSFIPNVDPTAPGYCDQMGEALREYATNNPGALNTGPASQQSGGTTPANPNVIHPNPDAYGFLDRYATQRIGIIPATETFVPLARSFTQFSRMTLVRGSGFEVFVDWKTTSMTEEQFRTLPNVNNFDANPMCEAPWCTFTRILPVELQARNRRNDGLRAVSGGTHMRIYYDADTDSGALVRMEVCERRTSANNPGCATATSVILPDGAALPSTGNLGAMPQFLMPYGFSNIRVQSACCYTTEVYISRVHER